MNQDLERLQNILSQQPELDSWEELIECLDKWPDRASLSAAVEYAQQQLTNWPDYLRTPPNRQWQAIQDGAWLPGWWRLVRHIKLGANDNILDPFPVAGLENITSIGLEEDICLSVEELNLLDRVNKLGALRWYDLIESLEELPENEPIDEILEAADRQLSNLPDEKRTVPTKYWKEIREGSEPISRWWKLVRHLKLGEDDGELSPLEAFINLTSLDISNSHLISIEPLVELTNLTSLKLVDDLVPFDIEPLTNLTQLVSLRLALPELTDVNQLAELKNLEKLDLSYGFELTSIQSLASLKKLSWLSLEECTELSDLTPLSELTALRYLDLSNCKSIADISPLGGLDGLQFLNVTGCDVLTDFSPLVGLTNCNIKT